MATPTASAASFPAGRDDYEYEMHLTVPMDQIVAALTDDTVIRRWWTSVTESARHDDEVQLFMSDQAPLVFSIDHTPGTGDVTWTVTACGFLPDWVGTTPSFSVRPNEDGGSHLSFRHVGLRPGLECFDQCRAGWNHFMPSLHQFLELGEGLPNQPRLASA